MKKEELLKRCRYIGTGKPFEHYEKMWLDWKLGKEGAISPEFEAYDQFGLKHFMQDDGVPKGIKAYLFTAYVHWNDINPTKEGFADFYINQYIAKSPIELMKRCKYYKGEDECFYKNEKATLWAIERMWVEMSVKKSPMLTDAMDEYLSYGLLKFQQLDDTPISLKALLFNRLMKYDERIDIESFKSFYQKYY